VTAIELIKLPNNDNNRTAIITVICARREKYRRCPVRRDPPVSSSFRRPTRHGNHDGDRGKRRFYADGSGIYVPRGRPLRRRESFAGVDARNTVVSVIYIRVPPSVNSPAGVFLRRPGTSNLEYNKPAYINARV